MLSIQELSTIQNIVCVGILKLKCFPNLIANDSHNDAHIPQNSQDEHNCIEHSQADTGHSVKPGHDYGDSGIYDGLFLPQIALILVSLSE